MNQISRRTAVVAGLVFTLGITPSWGQPPDPTPSDVQGNTAGGANALRRLFQFALARFKVRRPPAKVPHSRPTAGGHRAAPPPRHVR